MLSKAIGEVALEMGLTLAGQPPDGKNTDALTFILFY